MNKQEQQERAMSGIRSLLDGLESGSDLVGYALQGYALQEAATKLGSKWLDALGAGFNGNLVKDVDDLIVKLQAFQTKARVVLPICNGGFGGQPVFFWAGRLSQVDVLIYESDVAPGNYGFTGCEADVFSSYDDALHAALLANPDVVSQLEADLEARSALPETVIANVTSFAFNNPQGGTGMSNWPHNQVFDGDTAVRLVKCWHDNETGWRFIGVSHSDALNKYLDQNASPADRRVLFSEFDLIAPQIAADLVEKFAVATGLVQTSDGYRFVRAADGSWSDGDMTFQNFNELFHGCDITVQSLDDGLAGGLRVFEVTAAGFDASTDETDDLVFWVTAPSEDVVQAVIKDTGATFRSEPPSDCVADADFQLPRQAIAFSSELLEKASDLRNLNRQVPGR